MNFKKELKFLENILFQNKFSINQTLIAGFETCQMLFEVPKEKAFICWESYK